MDSGRADILAGIRRLRAKAAEQLTGNEYYMIVQQLDSLAASAEISDDAARSMFNLISRRLEGAPAGADPGGPEVPDTPDTPAQPDTPSTPEDPVTSPSPAQPDGSPGPDIPSPPGSPAEPQTPSEIPSTGGTSAAFEERAQVITPRANSFGVAQATVAVRFPDPKAPDEALPADAGPAARSASGLGGAVMAVRTLIEQKLTGNRYYAAANLLGQLQILPPASEGGEITAPDGFDGAVALLRDEATRLSGVAHDEAMRVITALEHILLPKAEAAAPAQAAASSEAEPEPEPEPRTGFDDLAEAAWRRVQQVSTADPQQAAMLNGAAAPALAAPAKTAAPAPASPVEARPDPAPVMETKTTSPAPASAAQAEMMAKDIGEAFNDGGSESRSSEPCYLYEFELAGAGVAHLKPRNRPLKPEPALRPRRNAKLPFLPKHRARP